MALERYTQKNGKLLRCGYTTGSCAAGAAAACARILVTGQPVQEVFLDTPAGVRLRLAAEQCEIGDGWAQCAIRKDAGDDPDTTDGLLVFVRLEKAAPGVFELDGGEGVGRVTRPGLDQPPGAAAINRVPREMIRRAVETELEDAGAPFGVTATVFVPGGEQAAGKTYNPRLGIAGGISILGTTGLVEPMSEAALVDTIHAELSMLREQGAGPLLIAPGSYGEEFIRSKLGIPGAHAVLCSNFFGETFDEARRLGFAGVLLVGHLGKLVKLAGGIYQTHSHVADGRMEILTAHAALAGVPRDKLEQLFDSVTTDAALEILGEKWRGPVLERILERIQYHMQRRLGEIPCGAVVFSNPYGILGKCGQAERLLAHFQKQKGDMV